MSRAESSNEEIRRYMERTVVPAPPCYRLEEYAEVRITVRLPGTLTSDGEPMIYGYTRQIAPEDVRVENPSGVLPSILERAANRLALNLAFR